MISNKESLWDRELIISRDTSNIYPFDLTKKGVFRLYYDYEKGISYAKISRTDENYGVIKSEAKRAGIQIEEIGDVLFINLSNTQEISNIQTFTFRDISMIKGVIKDPFTIWKEGREYIRYRFLEESQKEVSDFLFKNLEILKENVENYWKIEYLGKNLDSVSYLKKYGYPRKVISLRVREVDTLINGNFFPHYLYPHMLFFILGEINVESERAIRFSQGPTTKGGIVRESMLLRDGEIKIYEDTRNITSFSISSLSREPFASFPLEFYQHYDGSNVFLYWWIDEDDLNFLLRRIKKFNEINKNQVELLLDEINYII